MVQELIRKKYDEMIAKLDTKLLTKELVKMVTWLFGYLAFGRTKGCWAMTGFGQGLPGSSQPGREDSRSLMPGPARRPHRLGMCQRASHVHPCFFVASHAPIVGLARSTLLPPTLLDLG